MANLISANVLHIARLILAATATKPATPKVAVRVNVPEVGEVTCWIDFSKKSRESGITQSRLAALGLSLTDVTTPGDLTAKCGPRSVAVSYREPSDGYEGSWELSGEATAETFAALIPA